MRQILFVTYDDDRIPGRTFLCYRYDQNTQRESECRFVRKIDRMSRFDDLMSAISFAEVNEGATAKKIVEESDEKVRQFAIKYRSVMDKCRRQALIQLLRR